MEGDLRRIPLSRRSHVTGFQSLATGLTEHESALERDFVTLTSFVDARAVVRAQPVTIHFEDGGRRRRYTPDFRVEWSDGGCEIIEIKYRADLRAGWTCLRPAFAAARHWSHSNGARFRIASERGIRGPQLDTAKRLLPLRSAPIDIALAERAIAHARAHAVSFGDLINVLPVSRDVTIHLNVRNHLQEIRGNACGEGSRPSQLRSGQHGRNPMINGGRQPSYGGTSRMNREVHVRICEIGCVGCEFENIHLN